MGYTRPALDRENASIVSRFPNLCRIITSTKATLKRRETNDSDCRLDHPDRGWLFHSECPFC